MTIQIKRNIIEGIIEAARNTYPKEFFALLGSSDKKVIDELIVVPAIYGFGHVLVRSYLIPIDFKIVGSVHSHPEKMNNPSSADIKSFSEFGDIHLIIAWPFDINSIQAYDVSGKPINWQVID